MSADMRSSAPAELDGGELTPGEHLRAEIERLGLDQVAVSQATGVSRQSINNIVNGRQPISRAMAGKLGRLTGHSSDYWLRASFPRGVGAARADTAASAEREARPLGVGIMVNHQIIRAVKDGIIGIDPFDGMHVQPASVVLTLDDFVITAEGEKIDISDGERFLLTSGRTVNANTREWLEFPQDYIGRIGAMETLASSGLVTLHGFQIGPGFRGNLQFCIFNAGRKDFELRGGNPIIAVEIVPLTATPAPAATAASEAGEAGDPGHRDTVVSLFRTDAGERLIRDAVRARTEIELDKSGATARIGDLNIEILDASADAALDAAVRAALGGLKTLRDKPNGAREDREKYGTFFGDIAERLYLTGEQTRRALGALGLPTDGSDTLIATLRDGADAVVALPTRSARISLRQLARQLHEDPLDLILMLVGAKPYQPPA